jgi:hypothetical protein
MQMELYLGLKIVGNQNSSDTIHVCIAVWSISAFCCKFGTHTPIHCLVTAPFHQEQWKYWSPKQQFYMGALFLRISVHYMVACILTYAPVALKPSGNVEQGMVQIEKLLFSLCIYYTIARAVYVCRMECIRYFPHTITLWSQNRWVRHQTFSVDENVFHEKFQTLTTGCLVQHYSN